MTEKRQCDTMFIAVVQAQDAENAQDALESLQISVSRLPSVGGFLGRRNAMLLIAFPHELKSAVIDALHESCRQRTEYIAVPLESAPLPLASPTPVTIGGATVLELAIEHYEEL